ncbi:MAG: hypothetical protein ABI239_13105 [Aquihabitans sp.]
MICSAGPRHAAATVALVAMLSMIGAACTDSDDGSDEAFCARLAEAPALSTVIDGFTSASPDDLDQRLSQAAESYSKLRDAAPSEVDDEVDTLVDLVDAVIDAVRTNPEDPVAAADQVRSVVGQHPDAATASETVTEYASRTCKIELGTTTVPGP